MADKVENLIIGSGPAGLNAAIGFAEHGQDCTLVDENAEIGGLIFRQSSRNAKNPLPDDYIKARWHHLEQTFQQHSKHVTLSMQTEVLSLDHNDSKVIVFDRQTRSVRHIEYKNVILATGCHERSQPFPGWTLPGVMTVGGMQMQMKQNHVRPGSNVVLVGSGPLLLLTAVQLTHCGVKVLGVFEAGKRATLARHFMNLLRGPELLQQGIKYLMFLRSRGVPVFHGWGIVSATGDDTLREVTVAPYDRDWSPLLLKAKQIVVDGLGVSYGFVSRSQLSYMSGCEHSYEKDTGGFRPTTDGRARTSQKGVYVAGDCVGIRGAEMAELEGKQAAMSAMLDGQHESATRIQREVDNLDGRIDRLRTFRKAIDAYTAIGAGVYDLPNDDTLICRCENIRFKELKAMIATEPPHLSTLKMKTRVGMGDCQGRTCSSFAAEYLHQKANIDPMQVSRIRPRFPLYPLSYQSLVEFSRDARKE